MATSASRASLQDHSDGDAGPEGMSVGGGVTSGGYVSAATLPVGLADGLEPGVSDGSTLPVGLGLTDGDPDGSTLPLGLGLELGLGLGLGLCGGTSGSQQKSTWLTPRGPNEVRPVPP